MIETSESESVATVAERYRQRGFEVFLEPDDSLLPREAKSLQPDLLAIKGNEHVIVEVRYPQNLLAYPALTRLAETIRRIPGWRLDVVVLEKPRQSTEPEPLSVDAAKRRLETADRVANETEDFAAALLLTWTAVEALFRSKIESVTDVPVMAPLRLPKLAYSLGLIDYQDFAVAEWAASIRNSVVHGRNEPIVTRVDFDKVREFALRLLNGDNATPHIAS